MNIAEIEAAFADIRAKVGGFTAGMEDHIAHLLGKAGSDEPAPVVAAPPVADAEVAEAIETMSAPVEGPKAD